MKISDARSPERGSRFANLRKLIPARPKIPQITFTLNARHVELTLAFVEFTSIEKIHLVTSTGSGTRATQQYHMFAFWSCCTFVPVISHQALVMDVHASGGASMVGSHHSERPGQSPPNMDSSEAFVACQGCWPSVARRPRRSKKALNTHVLLNCLCASRSCSVVGVHFTRPTDWCYQELGTSSHYNPGAVENRSFSITGRTRVLPQLNYPSG